MEELPDFSTEPPIGPSPQRQWIAEAGALLSRVSTERRANFNTGRIFINQYWNHGTKQILGSVQDAIEELKLALQLSCNADIGKAYAPGDVYRYFSDLKSIVKEAQSEIFLIDPYFNGEAFDSYLADVGSDIGVRIFSGKPAPEVKLYVDKHRAEFNTNMEVKRGKKLHDRLIIIDRTDCWITGGSFAHGGQRSPAFLIPIDTKITNDKLAIYEDIWNNTQNMA